MPKSDNQKLKILYILDYLQKNSHQDHPVRTSELLSMLEEHDIVCDRKTVYSDIAALQDYGVDILSIPGKNGGYYIASRNFELPELKLLIDAVQSSRFLTEKKSRELIEKLCSQCSVHDARLMRRDVLVSGRVKSMNESITLTWTPFRRPSPRISRSPSGILTGTWAANGNTGTKAIRQAPTVCVRTTKTATCSPTPCATA